MWCRSKGRANLYSWTVVWRTAMPEFQIPYVPAIVLLEEGAYLMSAIVGCEPSDLATGMPLTVVFESYGDVILPYFDGATREDAWPAAQTVSRDSLVKG